MLLTVVETKDADAPSSTNIILQEDDVARLLAGHKP